MWFHVIAIVAFAGLCGLWAIGQRASGRGAERGGCGGGGCLKRATGACEGAGTCTKEAAVDRLDAE